MKRSLVFILKICFLPVFIITIFPCTSTSQGLFAGYFLRPQLNSMYAQNTTNSDIEINTNQTYTLYQGIEIGYFFTEKLGIGTRIAFGSDAQKFIYERTVNLQVVDLSAHHYRASLIKFPLQVKFRGRVGKIRFLVEGGPQIGYLIRLKNSGDWGNFNYTSDYDKVHFGFQFATGIGYQLNDHFMAFVTPAMDVMRLSFHHTTENRLKTYPLDRSITSTQLGLQVGFTWTR